MADGMRKTGRAFRRKMRRKKLKDKISMLEYCPYFKGGHTNYKWMDGEYVRVGTYIKFSKNSNLQKFYKRYSNKVVRRCPHEIPNGNAYRKIFDYWWTIC